MPKIQSPFEWFIDALHDDEENEDRVTSYGIFSYMVTAEGLVLESDWENIIADLTWDAATEIVEAHNRAVRAAGAQ